MATGWCEKLWQFVMVRAMEGLGEFFIFLIPNSLIADYDSKKTRSTALSLHQLGFYLRTIAESCLGA